MSPSLPDPSGSCLHLQSSLICENKVGPGLTPCGAPIVKLCSEWPRGPGLLGGGPGTLLPAGVWLPAVELGLGSVPWDRRGLRLQPLPSTVSGTRALCGPVPKSRPESPGPLLLRTWNSQIPNLAPSPPPGRRTHSCCRVPPTPTPFF